MVLPLPPVDGPGGMLYFEYAEVAAGERHSLRLHVAQFDQAPTGPDNDYAYTGTGPVSPSESGLLATFAAMGALWAAYYPPDWTLTLVDVWFNAGGRLTRLDVVPSAAPIAGVCVDPEPGGVVQKRIFRVVAPNKSARRVYFSQVPGAQTWQNTPVSPTAGGVDARDQAVMAYFAGSAGGIVSGQGPRFLPDARLRVQWARRLAPTTTGGTDSRDTWVGPTPPALPQDGWLWVDTALHGPPYQLKVYRASLAAWIDVGLSVDDDSFIPAGECGDLLFNDGTGWQLLDAGLYGDVLTVQRVSACLTPAWRSPCCETAGQGVTGRSSMQGGAWLIHSVQSMQGGALLDAGVSALDCAAGTCGAARLMAGKLIDQYNIVRSLLFWMLSAPFLLRTGLARGTTALAKLIQALLAFLGETGAPLWVLRVVSALGLVADLKAVDILSDLETLPANGEQILARLLRPCLTCTDGTVVIDDQTLACWEAAIEADSADFTELERHTLVYALQFSGLSTYGDTGTSGAEAPPELCFVNAMQGGAQITSLVTAGAMQGGARLLLTDFNAQRGGAVLA